MRYQIMLNYSMFKSEFELADVKIVAVSGYKTNPIKLETQLMI